MQVRSTLAILALATAGCGHVPERAPEAAPTRDFNSLNEREIQQFSACTIAGLNTMPAQRVREALAGIIAGDPTKAAIFFDPRIGPGLQIGIGLSLAQDDCAKVMNITPATVPPVDIELEIHTQPIPGQQRRPATNGLSV